MPYDLQCTKCLKWFEDFGYYDLCNECVEIERAEAKRKLDLYKKQYASFSKKKYQERIEIHDFEPDDCPPQDDLFPSY